MAYGSNKPHHLVCEGFKIESDEEKANLFAENFVNVSIALKIIHLALKCIGL